MDQLKLRGIQIHQVQNRERETQESPLSQIHSEQFVLINEVQPQKKSTALKNNTRKQKITSYLFSEIKVICAIFCLLIVFLVCINIFAVQSNESNDAIKISTNQVYNIKRDAIQVLNAEAKGLRAQLRKQKQMEQLQQKKSKKLNETNLTNQNTNIKQSYKPVNETLKSRKMNISDLSILFPIEEIVKPQKQKKQASVQIKKQKKQAPVQIKKQKKQAPVQITKQAPKISTPTQPTQNKNIKNTKNKNRKPQKKTTTKSKKPSINILSNITKNPYEAQSHAMITKQQLKRAIKWRTIGSNCYNSSCPNANQQLKYYEQKYKIGKYTQLPFCLVVPTINNKAKRRAERNLKSILMQNYSNYKVIFIDDGSKDGTASIIDNFMKKQKKISPNNYKIIAHKERHFALPNVLNAAKTFCKPQDIFMVIDGDDELIGKQVLKLFNAVFQKQQVWFMYTNFVCSNGALGYSRPYPPQIIKNNTYRDYGFTVTHLRAYYTQLLLNIKDEDLRNENGNYFTAAGDMAIVMPCLQQSNERVKYIPQITYLYNINTGQNVHKQRINEQRMNNLKIRAKPRYRALQKLF